MEAMPRRTRAPRLAALILAAGLALAACAPTGVEQPEAAEVLTSDPGDPLTVIAEPAAHEASVATSMALFDSSPLVVIAASGDVEGQELSARAAVRLGVPLLIAPGGTSTDPSPAATAAPMPALTTELQRLSATAALVVGDVPALAEEDGVPGVTVERIEPTASALRDAIGVAIGEPTAPDPAGFAAGIAALGPERSPGLADTVALAVDAVEHLAPIATARAAGVPVHLVPPDSVDPRADASVIDALHAAGASRTLAIGPGFGAQPALDWQVRAARSGFQLPGGGQLLFDERQFVALYGTPGSSVLGVLGEQDAQASVQRAHEIAAAYAPLTDETVVPAFEIIATVAAAGPGPDGNYSNELPVDGLRPWVDAAAAAGMYVVIDLQPGRTDFLTQAKRYQSLLELPHVGLALDPEWRLEPDEVHLRQIGSVDAAEVNSVATWLADLTEEHGLPQKMLVLHQFRRDMIGDRQALDLSRPELSVVVHVDGQGAPADKQTTWAAMMRDAPAGLHWGWKNFYDEDLPMLTPEQTMAEVAPVPDLVTYQ